MYSVKWLLGGWYFNTECTLKVCIIQQRESSVSCQMKVNKGLIIALHSKLEPLEFAAKTP